MFYAKPLLKIGSIMGGIILISGTSIYAYSSIYKETISERVERENKEILLTCLDDASTKPTTQEILQAKNACAESILTKIVAPTNSGTVTPAISGVPGGHRSKSVSLGCEWGEIQKVEGIEFHYTATHEETTLQAIKNGHTTKYGSEHIGYHYVIKPNGEITNTRDESCVAGADKWHKNNYRFIQIAFVGDDKPTREQADSMARLAKSMQIKYNLPIDAVSAHSDWGPKSKKESLEHWFGSKEEFIKLIRYFYVISIYGNGSEELQYMWRAWGDLDFIATIFQESRMNHKSIGDGGNSFGYCQIHRGLQPGWHSTYKSLKTMQERLNYCHELYTYAKGLKGGVGSRFHGYDVREKHIKNIIIK